MTTEVQQEFALPETAKLEWSRRAAAVTVPPLLDDPRHHARSIADELDFRTGEDDPYVVAVREGESLARTYLSGEILEAIADVGRGRRPYVVVRNLPVDDLDWDRVEPPTDGRRPNWKLTWVSEMSLLGAVQAAHLHALGYWEEGQGALVQEVAPVNGREFTNSGTGRKAFGWHTDNAIHPRQYRATGIALLGLVNDGGVGTTLASLDSIIDALGAENIETLAQPFFSFPAPESFEYAGGPFLSKPQPVLTRCADGSYEIGVSLYGVHACARRAEAKRALEALDALDVVLGSSVSEEVVVGRTDLLVMSNVRCMHARNAIQGRRWLQRSYFRDSLEQLRANELTTDARLPHRFRTRAILTTNG